MGFSEFFQKNKTTIIIVLVIIVVYYIVVMHCNSSIYGELVTGFWKADKDFLADAGLTSFLLYFAPSDWKGNRACYLLAEKCEELVINEPCSAKLAQNWKLGNWSTGFGVKSYDLVFSDLETEDMPHKQTLNFYPKTGKLILSKGDTIYGVFYKDSYLTDTMYQTEIIKPEEASDEEEE